MYDLPNAAFLDRVFENNPEYALHLATNHGDVPEIHRLLDAGHDIDVRQVERGMFDGLGTALHVAVWRDQPAAFAALLERGADMDILDEGSVNIRNEDTPIRLAVRLGRRDMVKILWDLGAQRQKYPEDSSPYKNEYGTLLNVAASEGQTEIVSDLLYWDKSWTADQQSHALHLSCAAFHVDVATLLLAAFCYDQTKLEDIAFYTATCEPAPHQPYSSREEKWALQHRDGVRQAKVIAKLLDTHLSSVMGLSQAHQNLLSRLLPVASTSSFRIETLRLLLERGADPNHQNEDNGRTALKLALNIRRNVGTFNEEGVKVLLKYGAKADMLDEDEKRKLEVWKRENMGGSRAC